MPSVLKMLRTRKLAAQVATALAAFTCISGAWAAGAAAPAPALASSAQAPGNCPVLLNRVMPRLQDEAPQNLCQYAGRVVLVVNTASFCGFTSQYKGLEALHARFRDRGLVVLGFPSNDFGSQEPGSNQDIAAFCENTFGVKFPMFAKSHVVEQKPGQGELNPLFADLRAITGKVPRWNFHKYLIARDGRTVQAFGSMTGPQEASFVAAVEKLLGSP